jgi:hypothetical protein
MTAIAAAEVLLCDVHIVCRPKGPGGPWNLASRRDCRNLRPFKHGISECTLRQREVGEKKSWDDASDYTQVAEAESRK